MYTRVPEPQPQSAPDWASFQVCAVPVTLPWPLVSPAAPPPHQLGAQVFEPSSPSHDQPSSCLSSAPASRLPKLGHLWPDPAGLPSQQARHSARWGRVGSCPSLLPWVPARCLCSHSSFPSNPSSACQLRVSFPQSPSIPTNQPLSKSELTGQHPIRNPALQNSLLSLLKAQEAVPGVVSIVLVRKLEQPPGAMKGISGILGTVFPRPGRGRSGGQWGRGRTLG